MTEENFEPLHQEMGRHVTSGILNTGMAQIVKILCQFGSVIILSRLLPPSDFGIIAMAGPVYGFVMMFQDLGLGQATVQKATINHKEINTFFWINIFVGIILSSLLILLSPIASWYYDDPRVGPLTAAMGVLIFIGSCGNQHGAILQRRMQFRISALLDALTTFSSLVVSIIFAFFVKGYWALYFGLAAGTLIPVIAIWTIVRWRPTAPHFVENTKEMLKFGAGISTSNLMNFLSRNMDNVLIGRHWGEHELGLYDRSYKLLLFPLQRIVFPLTNIMVPVLSRLVNDAERYKSIFLRTLSQLTLAIWPGIVWAIIFADTLIPLLLGPKWQNSSPMFKPLAIAGLLQILNSSGDWLMISQGRSGDLARYATVNAITSVIAFFIGLPYGGLGVATAYAVSEWLRTPFLWLYITRRGNVKIMDIIKSIAPQSVSILIAGTTLSLLQSAIDVPPVLMLSGGLILIYVITGLTMLIFPDGRTTLKQTTEMATRLLARFLPKKNMP